MTSLAEEAIDIDGGMDNQENLFHDMRIGKLGTRIS